MRSNEPPELTSPPSVFIRIKRDVLIHKINLAIGERDKKIQRLVASSISVTHTDLPKLRNEVNKLKSMHDAATISDRYAWINDEGVELLLRRITT